MLSVVDLLEANTLTVAQTAWLLVRILRGSSWLVGASPGGAGKTTVMSALLAMLPRGAPVWLTNRGSGWRECKAGDTLVSYELSPGFYDAYIWGADVVRLTELGMTGCRIVSNLHADTLSQARTQIVGECGATEEGFRAFAIFIPLSLRGSRFAPTPTVERIDYVRDGRWCRLARDELERSRRGLSVADEPDTQERPPAEEISEFVRSCRSHNIRLIEDVQEAWLEWCERNNLK
ncbi:MAG: hypothetical protein JSV89_05120 [Spirochaetaceae bacterium]|nr:MAG: hypothetical protein JSV89_05120 [Spirochaetaceae bacterium]